MKKCLSMALSLVFLTACDDAKEVAPEITSIGEVRANLMGEWSSVGYNFTFKSDSVVTVKFMDHSAESVYWLFSKSEIEEDVELEGSFFLSITLVGSDNVASIGYDITSMTADSFKAIEHSFVGKTRKVTFSRVESCDHSN